MTTTPHGQVPEALRLAEYIDDLMDGSMVNYVIDDLEKAAAELRRLHAYCQELEAQVIRDCMTHVQNPAEIEHVADDVSKNGAELDMSTQQPAPATQQAGATKEHLRLVRVIADKIEDGTLFQSGIYSNKDLARFVRNVADAATPQPSPTTQAAESVPALDRDRIREIFMAHGFTVKEGQTDLKQYVYDAADALLRAARDPADSVQKDAACWHWLAEYLVGTRTDLDDEIVASETVNDLRKLVKAAIKQGASHDNS